jgi:hypothetical protein
MHFSGAYRLHCKFSKISGEESKPSMAALFRAVNGIAETDIPRDELYKLYTVMKIFAPPPKNSKESLKRHCKYSGFISLNGISSKAGSGRILLWYIPNAPSGKRMVQFQRSYRLAFV